MSFRLKEQRKCCAVIPVYQSKLTDAELFNMRVSSKFLNDVDVFIVCPADKAVVSLGGLFPESTVVSINPRHFDSKEAYSRLLLSVDFYQIFLSFEYILILQTDALLLNSSLLDWCNRGFHYVGAPLGVQVNVNSPELLADLFPAHSPFRSRLPVGTVGNGGLSLRHVRRTIELLQSNATLAHALSQAGLPEDLFFMLAGVGVADFRVPNEATAARFAFEMHGPEYIKIGYPLPLGLHGWERFDKAFWLKQFFNLGLLPVRE